MASVFSMVLQRDAHVCNIQMCVIVCVCVRMCACWCQVLAWCQVVEKGWVGFRSLEARVLPLPVGIWFQSVMASARLTDSSSCSSGCEQSRELLGRGCCPSGRSPSASWLAVCAPLLRVLWLCCWAHATAAPATPLPCRPCDGPWTMRLEHGCGAPPLLPGVRMRTCNSSPV